MFVFPNLLRLCFLLLPLTVVGRPANPSSCSKAPDKGGSHDVVEGLCGDVRMLGHANRPVRRRAEDKIMVAPWWTSGEMITTPKPPTPFTLNRHSNTTTLGSSTVNSFPFDINVGPLEINGFVDLDNLDVEAEVYVGKFAAGVFVCNLHKNCKISIDLKLVKGVVELYSKNKYEVWALAKLGLPFGKSYQVDKKVFDLPHDRALAGGPINSTIASSGLLVAAPKPLIDGTPRPYNELNLSASTLIDRTSQAL